MGDAHQDLLSKLGLGRAILITLLQKAGKSQTSRYTPAASGCMLHNEQPTATRAHPAQITRPLQARQRLAMRHPQYPSAPRRSGFASRLEALTSHCHEVEGMTRNLHKAPGFCAAAQGPAVSPTLPTPKILSAIKQNRREYPPETFLGGGAPSSPSSLRIRRTLPPHTGKPALVCLNAFGSPRGNWRG